MPPTVPHGVIVADDSSLIRSTVRDALGDQWRIFLAKDGAEALDYARSVAAELVLLDFRMPRLDGLEACSIMRAMPSYDGVPIVLLTAYDGGELRRRAVQAGATAVFPKPFTADELRNGVLPLISLSRDAGRAVGRVAASDALPPAADGLAAGRDVLAVHRKVDQAAEQRRYVSFPEAMASRRARSSR